MPARKTGTSMSKRSQIGVRRFISGPIPTPAGPHPPRQAARKRSAQRAGGERSPSGRRSAQRAAGERRSSGRKRSAQRAAGERRSSGYDGARENARVTAPRYLVVVPHTHWDREWYRTREEFRHRLARPMAHLLDLLARDPAFRTLPP